MFRGPPETGMPGNYKETLPLFKRLKRLETFSKYVYFFQDEEIWKRYMKRFAKTVVKVLMAYSDVLKRDFPNHVKDESTVSTAVGLFISNDCCKNYLAPFISIDCCKNYLVIFISNDCCKNYLA